MREESSRRRFADCQKFTIEDVRQVLADRRNEPEFTVAVSKTATVKVKEKPRKKIAAARAANESAKNETPDATPMKKKKSASVLDILGFNPFEPETQRIQYDCESVPRQWRTYFDRLIAMREELEKHLFTLTKETLRQGDVGDSDMPNMLGQHAADGVAQETDLTLAHSFVANERELLEEVNAALERIKNKTYGICQQTGEKISSERLSAQPYARFSIAGQLEYEAQRKKQPTATVGNLFQIADGDENGQRDGESGDLPDFE